MRKILDICIFVSQGEQLLLTWQRAGHTEDSLRRLLHQEQPETQSALQLLLVKVFVFTFIYFYCFRRTIIYKCSFRPSLVYLESS